MQYLYHRRHPGFVGTTIYPLNQLRAKFPDLHAAQARKYAGRERITGETVPVVDALWNDLVHCAPIHPRTIFRALTVLERAPEAQEWFRIPVAKIQRIDAVWFDPQNERYPFPVRDGEVTMFDPSRYRELRALPARTLRYYRALTGTGQPSLLFLYVPHVLVHGLIDVSDVDVVDWSA